MDPDAVVVAEEEDGDGDGDERRLLVSPRNDWESVASLLLTPGEHSRGWEMVAVGRGVSAYDDDCSVFPPSDHEGLHVEQGFLSPPEGGLASGGGRSEPVAATASFLSSKSSSSCFPFFSSPVDGGAKWRRGRQLWHWGEWKAFVDLARRMVRSGYELLCCRLPLSRVGVGCGGVRQGAVWRLAAVAGLAAVLLYIRRRYRRERLRLLLLIQQKDQKISQLLLQIAQLNEVISSRRRIPVLRTS